MIVSELGGRSLSTVETVANRRGVRHELFLNDPRWSCMLMAAGQRGTTVGIMVAGTAQLESLESGGELLVAARGRWDITSVAPIERRLRELRPGPTVAISIDLAQLEGLDTIGAWLL